MLSEPPPETMLKIPNQNIKVFTLLQKILVQLQTKWTNDVVLVFNSNTKTTPIF